MTSAHAPDGTIGALVVTEEGALLAMHRVFSDVPHGTAQLETGTGDLSTGMKKLNGTYALRFNKDNGFTGHVFEERFQHTRLRSEWHLVNVIRYLALNPVEAGLVKEPADWIWGSFAAVLGIVRPPDFLDVDWTLRLFGDEPSAARERLLRLASAEPELRSA